MKPRVLLVDDEPALLHCLGAVLASAGIDVHLAASAAIAIAALGRTQFDLIITDMAMETDTAGWDVLGAAQRLGHRPPVIILTAFLIPASTWKEKGATELVTKGQKTPGAFIQTVRELLNRSGHRTQPQTAPPHCKKRGCDKRLVQPALPRNPDCTH